MVSATHLLADWGGLHLEMSLGTSNALLASTELNLAFLYLI